MSCAGCPRNGGGKPTHRQGRNHHESHTTPRPTDDPRFPGGTFESRQAISNDGQFLGKTTIVKDASGRIAEVKRGKNSKAGPGRGRLGFVAGLFNFLSK